MAGSSVAFYPDTTAYELVGSGTASRQFQRSVEVVNHTALITGDGMPTPGTKVLPVIVQTADAVAAIGAMASLVKAARAASRVRLLDQTGTEVAYVDVAAFKRWQVKRWPMLSGVMTVFIEIIPRTADWQATSAEEVREW